MATNQYIIYIWHCEKTHDLLMEVMTVLSGEQEGYCAICVIEIKIDCFARPYRSPWIVRLHDIISLLSGTTVP